jgi:hypothetical protein
LNVWKHTPHDNSGAARDLECAFDSSAVAWCFGVLRHSVPNPPRVPNAEKGGAAKQRDREKGRRFQVNADVHLVGFDSRLTCQDEEVFPRKLNSL